MPRRPGELPVTRLDRLIQPLAFAVTLTLLAAVGVAWQRSGDADVIRVTAHFSKTVGLYAGSSVRVLGVDVGRVMSLEPEGTTVRAELEIAADVPIPAQATAVIIPPSLVSDRYVQLTPAYAGGSVMADGDDIPVDRTRTPIELDEILAGLDRLFRAVGPDGANADGSLGELVDVGAKVLGDGQGAALNATLRDLADAVAALSSGRDDLGGLITNLSSFTTTLARSDNQFRRFMADLGDVSAQLAGEREVLEQALANLSVALGEVALLVRDHRAALGADIETLASVTRTVMAHKQSLVEALDVLPMFLGSLVMAFNGERGTLDIRNNAEQGDQAFDIFLCQLLGLACGGPPGVPIAPAAPAGRDSFGVAGLLDGGR